MKALIGVIAGGLVALAIACGGAHKTVATSAAPPSRDVQAAGPEPSPASPREELDALDAEITAAMQQLGEARPQPPPNACIQPPCDATAMSTAAAAATAADDKCRPGKGSTCTQSCELKDSICKNTSRICTIASDLGGGDAYANEKCSSATASCNAAKKRCCDCV